MNDPSDDVTTKRAVCTVCDIACQLDVQVHDGKVLKILPPSNPVVKDNFCFKGLTAAKLYEQPGRLTKPLRRVGARGEGKWEEVSWETAMNDIAGRLRRVIDEHGPEALGVSTSTWNTSVDNGMGRRVMNLLGAPNWISGVAFCMGNTAAVNKMTLGWFPWPDLINTDLIVLNGHNPRKNSWTPIYNLIRQAQNRGAKLIVLDPRRSGQAERADIHLQLRAGTDAAMYLGWLHVILEEGLYDKQFVKRWTIGFDELSERVREYPLSRVEDITGVPQAQIAAAARMYAGARSATIPWSPVTDQQVSSTSAIRLQSIIKAICGFLDVPGGELLYGFNPEYVSESQLELHEELSQQQRQKQLGYNTHPAFTYRAGELLAPHTERVHGHPYANLITGSYMANPSEVFRAMDTGDPYPIKAFFSLGNNTLMSFANQPQIQRAFMNQDLVVVHELFMTPTAQLADYVLPGDTWLERPHVHDSYGWRSWLVASEQCVEPPPDCRGVFYFWRELAIRMGLEDHVPWKSVEEMIDHRLSPLEMSYEEFCASYDMKIAPTGFRKYRRTGFGTPSGKVELSSSVLADLGFDPLPYHREIERDPDFPLNLFVGVREDPYFMTGQRQLPSARKMSPLPKVFIHPDDAATYGLADADWAEISTPTGHISAVTEIREEMRTGHLRIPRGWWFPELIDTLHGGGAHQHNDAMLISDSEDRVDHEQGVPQIKGFPGAIRRLDHAPGHMSDVMYLDNERGAHLS